MVCLVRKTHFLLVFGLLLFAIAAAACRDLDKPPPLPVYDPNAPPLDGGQGGEPDAAEDGDIT